MRGNSEPDRKGFEGSCHKSVSIIQKPCIELLMALEDECSSCPIRSSMERMNVDWTMLQRLIMDFTVILGFARVGGKMLDDSSEQGLGERY